MIQIALILTGWMSVMIKIGDKVVSGELSGVVIGLTTPRGDSFVLLDSQGVMHEVRYTEVEQVINSPILH